MTKPVSLIKILTKQSIKLINIGHHGEKELNQRFINIILIFIIIEYFIYIYKFYFKKITIDN